MRRFLLTAILAVAPAVYGDNSYVQHNLVSDQVGQADHQDSNLVNPWGIDRSPTGPWWVADNKTSVSTVYDGTGQAIKIAGNPLVVAVPPIGTSSPTGIVFNGTQDFTVATGKPALFIFVTENGTISGWNPDVDPTHAILKATTSGAIYKGATLAQSGTGQMRLYVANFHSGSVDVFDSAFQPVSMPSGAFQDRQLPAG